MNLLDEIILWDWLHIQKSVSIPISLKVKAHFRLNARLLRYRDVIVVVDILSLSLLSEIWNEIQFSAKVPYILAYKSRNFERLCRQLVLQCHYLVQKSTWKISQVSVLNIQLDLYAGQLKCEYIQYYYILSFGYPKWLPATHFNFLLNNFPSRRVLLGLDMLFHIQMYFCTFGVKIFFLHKLLIRWLELSSQSRGPETLIFSLKKIFESMEKLKIFITLKIYFDICKCLSTHGKIVIGQRQNENQTRILKSPVFIIRPRVTSDNCKPCHTSQCSSKMTDRYRSYQFVFNHFVQSNKMCQNCA